MRFDWDERKNRLNQRKHGVSFEEASTTFFDEKGLVQDDPEHSNGEERFVLLGLSGRQRILLVCHCYRPAGEVIRIISARKATANEVRAYEQRWVR